MQNQNNQLQMQQIENLKYLTKILSEIVAECYILREEYLQFNSINAQQFANIIFQKTNEILKNEQFVNIEK
jgi:hypothetical protein